MIMGSAKNLRPNQFWGTPTGRGWDSTDTSDIALRYLLADTDDLATCVNDIKINIAVVQRHVGALEPDAIEQVSRFMMGGFRRQASKFLAMLRGH